MSTIAPVVRRPSAGFIAVNTLMLWAATAIAALALWPIYQDPQFIVLVAVTTVLGSIVAILGALFRWKSFVVILAGFAVLLLAGVPLAVPGQAIAGVLPSLDGIRALLAGVALGWKQLLTIALPVGDYQALLVPAFVLVLTSTIVALTVALRARWGELGVVPPVALFIVGIAFGPETVPWPVPWALGLLAVVLLWLIWRRWRKRRESIRTLTRATDPAITEAVVDSGFGVRNLVAGGVLLAVAAAASIGAASVLPPT
ncbi:MAG: transglutaminase domain-containing protein, partial [Pseudolysinimonas sp.]